MSDVVQVWAGSNAPVEFKNKWWLQPDDTCYRDIFAIVNKIEEAQTYRRSASLRHARLYHNLELLGFNPSQHSRVQEFPLLNNRVTLNVVKSCVDTLASKIAKNKPRPLFLTIDGDWALQTKAKKLTQYMDGLFDDVNIYEIGQRAFVDSLIFGTGVIKIYEYEGKVCAERVMPVEITVDEAEGIYGEPRQLHQTKYIHREVVLDMFPEFEEQIMTAKQGDKNVTAYYNASDLIVVRESWHLRSGDNANDGTHTICIENATLLKEEYNKDYFPFVFLRYTPRIVGFWGQGLVEELIGIQLEINKLLRNIQLAQHLVSVPRLMVDNSSSVNTQHISNEIASIVKYTGQKPEFISPTAMNGEIYSHLENLYRKAYEISGISQLSANAQKPQGLDSGKALREFNDIESERFQLTGQRYEKIFLDIAKIAVDISRDIYKSNKNLAIKSVNKKFIETIKWKDISIEDSSYMMRVFPTSLLSSTPAGKLADVQNLVQAGFIDKEQAMELLDFPDVEAYTSLATASLDNIKKIISDIIEEGVYNTPEPYMDIERASVIAQQSYLKARTSGVPEERLELLRRFITDCEAMKPLPPAPAMPMGQPMANPMPAPTSEILPINNNPMGVM